MFFKKQILTKKKYFIFVILGSTSYHQIFLKRKNQKFFQNENFNLHLQKNKNSKKKYDKENFEKENENFEDENENFEDEKNKEKKNEDFSESDSEESDDDSDNEGRGGILVPLFKFFKIK